MDTNAKPKTTGKARMADFQSAQNLLLDVLESAGGIATNLREARECVGTEDARGLRAGMQCVDDALEAIDNTREELDRLEKAICLWKEAHA